MNTILLVVCVIFYVDNLKVTHSADLVITNSMDLKENLTVDGSIIVKNTEDPVDIYREILYERRRIARIVKYGPPTMKMMEMVFQCIPGSENLTHVFVRNTDIDLNQRTTWSFFDREGVFNQDVCGNGWNNHCNLRNESYHFVSPYNEFYSTGGSLCFDLDSSEFFIGGWNLPCNHDSNGHSYFSYQIALFFKYDNTPNLEVHLNVGGDIFEVDANGCDSATIFRIGS